MTETQWMILAGVIAFVVLALVVLLAVRWSRRRRLRQRFGPEYEHTMEATGDRREAEKELARREKHHQQLQLREIPEERRREYRARWRRVQSDFVESPREAVASAESLVTEVLRDRGFPVDDFRERHDDISVEHPEVAADYRKANEIADRDASGEATTEELREAMVCFRRLFDAEVGVPEPARTRPTSKEQEVQR